MPCFERRETISVIAAAAPDLSRPLSVVRTSTPAGVLLVNSKRLSESTSRCGPFRIRSILAGCSRFPIRLPSCTFQGCCGIRTNSRWLWLAPGGRRLADVWSRNGWPATWQGQVLRSSADWLAAPTRLRIEARWEPADARSQSSDAALDE